MTTAPAAGYSGTPLPQKLGLKDGQRVLFIVAAAGAQRIARVAAFPRDGAGRVGDVRRTASRGYDLIHGFTASRAVLEKNARPLMEQIDRDGTIWISWPKKASKVATDITEDVIREVVLPIGLVDVKVAAVNEIWSGLKL